MRERESYMVKVGKQDTFKKYYQLNNMKNFYFYYHTFLLLYFLVRDLNITNIIIYLNLLFEYYKYLQVRDLKQAFSSLGDIISKYQDLLRQSRFIFVPGPSDPGMGCPYPRLVRVNPLTPRRTLVSPFTEISILF